LKYLPKLSLFFNFNISRFLFGWFRRRRKRS